MSDLTLIANRAPSTRPPDAVAQCKKCGRGWRSKKEAHCGRCCAHFTSANDYGFELHLVPVGDELVHLDPTAARDKKGSLVFEPVSTAYGISYRKARARTAADGRFVESVA